MKTFFSSSKKIFVYLLFFISGFCALIYEVVWSRMLVLVMGNTTLATTTILTAFMAGLSLGGLYWGILVDKTNKNPLFLFGSLELGIGITAVIVSKAIWLITPLETWALQLSGLGAFSQIMIRFLLCFCMLIGPTFLMGGTLAVMGRYIISDDGLFAQHTAGLYGINTAGSFLGAFLAGFFMIKFLGHNGSLAVAALLNCIVGIFAFLVSFQEKRRHTSPEISLEKTCTARFKENKPPKTTATLVLIGLGVSGFCAIAYQVIWTRLLILIIDNSVYSFTIILMGFLAGIALGSLMLATCFRLFKSPVLLFAIAEICIGISAFCFPFFIHLKPNNQNLAYLNFLFTTLPLGILIPTIFMGIAFPLGALIYQRYKGGIGKSIGVVYATNTTGCVLGGLATGFLLIGYLGFQKSLFVLTGLNLATGTLIGFLCLKNKFRYVFIATFIVFFISAFLAMPPNYFSNKYAEIEPNSKLIYYKESTSTTATVFERPDKSRVLYLNGIPEVDTSHLSIKTFKLMGALPGLLHENPENALMITFGAGVAAGTTALFTNHMDCVDLASQAREIAPYFDFYNNQIIGRKNSISLYADDARHFLRTSNKRYSVIISDATHPRVYDSWVLFTMEFYRLVKSRLTEDGIFLQWLPFHGLTLEQYLGIVRTFSDVFTHMSMWRVGQGYSLLLSTPQTLKIDYRAFEKRLTNPNIRKDLHLVGLDNPFEMLSFFSMGEESIQEMLSDYPLVMTDNNPAHLFFPFLSTFKDQYSQWPMVNYQKVKTYEESVVPFLVNINDSETKRKKLEDTVRYYEQRRNP